MLSVYGIRVLDFLTVLSVFFFLLKFSIYIYEAPYNEKKNEYKLQNMHSLEIQNWQHSIANLKIVDEIR